MTSAAPDPRRAYVDHPPTDLARAGELAERAARTWRLGHRPELLRRGMNAIYVAGDVVIRVGEPTAAAGASLDLARFLASHGVAVPMPARDEACTDGPLVATAWTRIETDGRPIDWRRVGEMVRLVHGLDRASLPPAVPSPRPERFPWWDFEEIFGDAASSLDAASAEGLRRAIDEHRGWVATPERVLCHGDVHPGNVIMSADGPVLIDWDLLCWAPPAWDHAPLMTWTARWGGAPGEYEAFADGYGASLREDPLAESLATLRLVAATLMRVIAGRTDPAAAREAAERLRFWRGDVDAPPWRAM